MNVWKKGGKESRWEGEEGCWTTSSRKKTHRRFVLTTTSNIYVHFKVPEAHNMASYVYHANIYFYNEALEIAISK